jgi:hypothetical protein
LFYRTNKLAQLKQFKVEMTEKNHDERNTANTLSAMYGGEGRGEVTSIAQFCL